MTSLNCSVISLGCHDDLSVIFVVLLGFIADYCYLFYRIISVILLLQPFFFVNVGVLWRSVTDKIIKPYTYTTKFNI